MRNIYVVGGHTEYANWMEGRLVPTLAEADLVVFTGGEDVSPMFYNEPIHPKTYFNTARDNAERAQFLTAKRLGKHLIGICRGSQFLCVMSGGKLVQDQQPQGASHSMQTLNIGPAPLDGRVVQVTSTHHQAQYPWELPSEDFKVLGWTEGLSSWHFDGRGHEIVKDMLPFGMSLVEVEVCVYYKTKALAIQSHPEYQHPGQFVSIDYFRQLLNLHMEDKL
jgi:GMP synthase-like glutamine amidotransferase